MGMYDTVIFSCPDCGSYLEHQTKAGPCLLGTISSVECPFEIAKAIVGEWVYCEKCDQSHQIEQKLEPVTTIKMGLR